MRGITRMKKRNININSYIKVKSQEVGAGDIQSSGYQEVGGWKSFGNATLLFEFVVAKLSGRLAMLFMVLVTSLTRACMT